MKGDVINTTKYDVALFARAWIEMAQMSTVLLYLPVALFARAWIEMFEPDDNTTIPLVALFARAWIEME